MSAWPRFRTLAHTLVLASLIGCGGGGGSGTGVAPPAAAEVEDILPSVATLAIGAEAYLPFGRQGDWQYVRTRWPQGAEWSGVQVTSTPSSASLTSIRTVGEGSNRTTSLRWSERGWELDARAYVGLPPTAVDPGSLLLYPRRFPQTATSSYQVRRGSIGRDTNGDGIHETYVLRLEQAFGGPENIEGPVGLMRTYRLYTTIDLTVVESGTRASRLAYRETWTEWLAEGAGPVRVIHDGIVIDGTGSQPTLEWRLAGVTIDGADPLAAIVVPEIETIALRHLGVVADPAHGRYLASLPAAAGDAGGRIAVIDARTGSVSTGLVLDGVPGAMALAGDGGSLFVALVGRNEVLRISLPDLAVVSRTKLPDDPFAGALQAGSLAASPTDAATFAVALRGIESSTRHGIALARDGSVLARSERELESEFVAFSEDGSKVFGVVDGSRGSWLRRLDVVDDGVALSSSRQWDPGLPSARRLEHDAGLLIFGGTVLDALGAARQDVTGASDCRRVAPGRMACLNLRSLGPDAAVVMDTRDLANPFELPLPWQAGVLNYREIVAGALPGTLAIRDGMGHPSAIEAQQLLLVRHPRLP